MILYQYDISHGIRFNCPATEFLIGGSKYTDLSWYKHRHLAVAIIHKNQRVRAPEGTNRDKFERDMQDRRKFIAHAAKVRDFSLALQFLYVPGTFPLNNSVHGAASTIDQCRGCLDTLVNVSSKVCRSNALNFL